MSIHRQAQIRRSILHLKFYSQVLVIGEPYSRGKIGLFGGAGVGKTVLIQVD
jgi:F0F1-type ATP synthase beta subunit